MKKALFMASFKANRSLAGGFAAFAMLYVVVSVMMFEPGSTAMIDGLMEMLPEGMVNAFGFDNISGDMTGYLSNYLYGFIMLVFPMIYGVIIANNLVAKHVDRGSMAYLLATPNTRGKIISTQFIYMSASIIGIFVIDVGLAIVICESMFAGQLMIGGFLMLNVVTILTTVALASVCFLFSCIFNESKIVLILGTVLSVFSVILHMLSSLGEETEFLKYMSLHTLVDIDKCLNDGGYVLIVSGALMLFIFAMYALSVRIFDKRNLII